MTNTNKESQENIGSKGSLSDEQKEKQIAKIFSLFSSEFENTQQKKTLENITKEEK